MGTFYAIYNTGNTLQYAFDSNTLHPHYIGAEFPIGQQLISAINIQKNEADLFFSKLVTTFIDYIDEQTEEKYAEFENALFNIDEYCIYLREIVDILLTMIVELHPRYQLSYLTHFNRYFANDEIAQLCTVVATINDNPEQTDNKFYLWSLCVNFLVDKFLDDIKIIQEDVYDICNISDGHKGLSRLNVLNNRRKLFYLNLNFRTSLATSIGESENSRILSTDASGNDEIIHCVFTEEILNTLYYEFLTALENNLPIKLCKNCNKPFIPKGRADSLYCDRIMPGFRDKCSVIGALNAYKNKLPDIESDFYAARRRYNTRVSRNPLLKTEFEVWKIKAREKLTAYRNGEISADEFKNWFMDDEWMKI